MLNGTFCVYCQRELVTNPKLVRHVLASHPGTYAASSVSDGQRAQAKENSP